MHISVLVICTKSPIVTECAKPFSEKTKKEAWNDHPAIRGM